jgi:hypothetical protein
MSEFLTSGARCRTCFGIKIYDTAMGLDDFGTNFIDGEHCPNCDARPVSDVAQIRALVRIVTGRTKENPLPHNNFSISVSPAAAAELVRLREQFAELDRAAAEAAGQWRPAFTAAQEAVGAMVSFWASCDRAAAEARGQDR